MAREADILNRLGMTASDIPLIGEGAPKRWLVERKNQEVFTFDLSNSSGEKVGYATWPCKPSIRKSVLLALEVFGKGGLLNLEGIMLFGDGERGIQIADLSLEKRTSISRRARRENYLNEANTVVACSTPSCAVSFFTRSDGMPENLGITVAFKDKTGPQVVEYLFPRTTHRGMKPENRQALTAFIVGSTRQRFFQAE